MILHNQNKFIISNRVPTYKYLYIGKTILLTYLFIYSDYRMWYMLVSYIYYTYWLLELTKITTNCSVGVPSCHRVYLKYAIKT